MQKFLSVLSMLLHTLLLSSCVRLTTIASDEIGVRFDALSGALEILPSGSYLESPFLETITIYPLSKQMYVISEEITADAAPITALTIDAQEVWIALTMTYRVSSTEVITLHTSWGHAYREHLLLPVIRMLVREIAGLYTFEELYAAPYSTIEEQLRPMLEKELSAYGLVLETVQITDVRFSDVLMQVLEARETASAVSATAEQRATELRVTDAARQTNVATPVPAP